MEGINSMIRFKDIFVIIMCTYVTVKGSQAEGATDSEQRSKRLTTVQARLLRWSLRGVTR